MTKAAANKEVKSFSEDHEGVIEAATGKKKILTITKMQKEITEQCDRLEAKGKYLYPLLEHHHCL